MSEYNRYTTQKGQLLLNIKPPSRANQSTITSQPSSVNVYPTNSRNIHYNTVNQSYNNPPSYQISGYPAPYGNSIVQPIVANWQINSDKAQNVRYYNPIANQVYPINTYTGQNPSSYAPGHLNHSNQIRKTPDQPKTNGNDYDYIGQADSDNSQKRGKRSSDTVCCFPAYWLICLLLTVVTLSFFLILFKYHQDSVAKNANNNIINEINTNLPVNTNSSQNSSSTNNPVNSSQANKSQNSSVNTNNPQNRSPANKQQNPSSPAVDMKNQPNTSYRFGPSSSFEPIYVPPINQYPSLKLPTKPTQSAANTNNVIYLQPVPASGHQLGKFQNLRHREFLGSTRV